MTESLAPLSSLLGNQTQLGFVVPDLDAALRHWTEVLGIGPFIVFDEGTGRPPAASLYHGKPQVIELRLAFAYMGEVQIELIEQVNDAPSPYRDFLAQGRAGLQHLGYVVPDFAAGHAGLVAAGYRPALEIPIAGQSHAITYFDAPDLMGIMIEIVPPAWQEARATVRRYLEAAPAGTRLLRHGSYGGFLAEQAAAKG